MPTLRYKLKVMKSRLKYAINPQLLYGKKSFYDSTRKGKLKSITKAAELIWETFHPKDVVDIGCGEGMFLNVLHQKGAQVLGCDISNAALNVAPKVFTIFQADATKPIRFNRKFDLCICVEIAEHIPPGRSKTLVKNVTQASDTIFFTAAPPGQGGVGHINEQTPAFWDRLFEAEGFELDKALTETLRAQMKEAKVIFWLQQNVMIYRRKTA
jgi:2-polyprenyl-3-methyl-5-hydroxy-6-metoxy-1,4-benzoquinol methylase